jgi:hypothetical protein
VRQFFPAGDYKVPDDMSPEVARRCVEAGIGKDVRTKATKPENKLVKKKRSKTVNGKRPSSSRPGPASQENK